MIKRLTRGNKKQMSCVCGNTFSWNTTEQNVIMGNRIIECPECGERYMVPSSELLPYYNSYNIVRYTQNIYNDENIDEKTSSLIDIGNSFVVFRTFGKRAEYYATKTFDQIVSQIGFNPQTGVIQNKYKIKGLYPSTNEEGNLVILNLDENRSYISLNDNLEYQIEYIVFTGYDILTAWDPKTGMSKPERIQSITFIYHKDGTIAYEIFVPNFIEIMENTY